MLDVAHAGDLVHLTGDIAQQRMLILSEDRIRVEAC